MTGDSQGRWLDNRANKIIEQMLYTISNLPKNITMEE